MRINNDFEIRDEISGLEIKIIEGNGLNIIKIKHINKPLCDNRSFFFGKDGKFDGTGSDLSKPVNKEK